MLSDGNSASAQAFSADAGGVAAEESTVDSEGAGWVPSAPALGASSAMVVWRARKSGGRGDGERSVACSGRRERCALWGAYPRVVVRQREGGDRERGVVVVCACVREKGIACDPQNSQGNT